MPPRLIAALALLLALGSQPAAAANGNSRFCSPSAMNVVLYLDVTTAYDDLDKSTLVDGVTRIFETLKGGERVSIRTIADEFSNSRRLVEGCVPYCESHGMLNDLFFSDCTEGVVINERKKLRAAIAGKLLEAMTASGDLPYSEIVRTFANSASEEFHADRPNAIYVFSDLIENSEYLPGKKFLWGRTDALLDMVRKDGQIPRLTDATIKVFGVGRGGNPEHRQALAEDVLQRLQAFWRAYFTEAGASLTLQQNLTIE